MCGVGTKRSRSRRVAARYRWPMPSSRNTDVAASSCRVIDDPTTCEPRRPPSAIDGSAPYDSLSDANAIPNCAVRKAGLSRPPYRHPREDVRVVVGVGVVKCQLNAPATDGCSTSILGDSNGPPVQWFARWRFSIGITNSALNGRAHGHVTCLNFRK